MALAELLAIGFNTALLAVCGLAFVKGGRPERIGAAINLCAALATDVLRIANVAHLAPADLSVFAIDVAVAGGFFWLGVATIRFWPIWAAGFAVADLFMSVCGALLPRVPLFAYHTGLGIYAYLALGALALGTLRLAPDAEPHIRNGSRRSWKRHLEETI
ncbi:hypothetical protein D3Y57_01060 (plasmid) [Sphingomonas paeninsulae]|jgi:hypothetical protein|uniref:Uncharacterized protein n=1 Tax=Sphingomonas paeninsulae TaxID=2319844 RepID=A0A494TGZ6_SPHPE|nr:hypothetical protein [Sphingomonas paeninsulae]AYJ84708.1 hypothetical protein D3Y57_01060 [Sphingomonas paeninsulae]